MRFNNNLCTKKLRAGFLNLFSIAILSNFLIFCKQIFSWTSNENVDVLTRKKYTFESVKKYFFCKKKMS